jgi:hypothetical protein
VQTNPDEAEVEVEAEAEQTNSRDGLGDRDGADTDAADSPERKGGRRPTKQDV